MKKNAISFAYFELNSKNWEKNNRIQAPVDCRHEKCFDTKISKRYLWFQQNPESLKIIEFLNNVDGTKRFYFFLLVILIVNANLIIV